MSIFSKLMFWKHDNLELPKYPASPTYDSYTRDRMGVDQGMNKFDSSLGLQKDPLQMNDSLGNYSNTGLEMNQDTGLGDSFEQQSNQTSFTKFRQTGLGQQVNVQTEEMNMAKNIEILTAKIETIKSMLDFLGHKIDKIEKIAEGEQQKPVSKRYQW